MSQYTKREWEQAKVGNVGITIYSDTEEGIVTIARLPAQEAVGMEANAHLIAAAPEMYEALKLYQAHQEGTHGHYCWQCAEAINKALAKAEGKI